MAILKADQGATLEEMVFRFYGQQSPDLVARVLELPENLDLANADLILPLGTAVHFPDDLPEIAEAETSAKSPNTTDFW